MCPCLTQIWSCNPKQPPRDEKREAEYGTDNPSLPGNCTILIGDESGKSSSHFQTEINFYCCQNRRIWKRAKHKRGVLLHPSSEHENMR